MLIPSVYWQAALSYGIPGTYMTTSRAKLFTSFQVEPVKPTYAVVSPTVPGIST